MAIAIRYLLIRFLALNFELNLARRFSSKGRDVLDVVTIASMATVANTGLANQAHSSARLGTTSSGLRTLDRAP